MTFSAVASGPDEPTTLTIHGEEGAMRLAGEDLLTAMRGEPFTAATTGERSDRRGNSAGGAFGTGTYYLGRALQARSTTATEPRSRSAATFEDGLVQQRVLDAARDSSTYDGIWTTV